MSPPDRPSVEDPHKQISLFARALSYLARREHSRAELARKLARYAAAGDDVEALLDQLQAQGQLSDARFAESTVRRRADRYGASRVAQELRSRGVDQTLVRETVQSLRATELQRAQALWQRRYGVVARAPAERMRQMRFLAARGFSADVIRQVVRGSAPDEA